jgi:hypothetical protein
LTSTEEYQEIKLAGATLQESSASTPLAQVVPINWGGSTPKGERVASHDPPLALSQSKGSRSAGQVASSSRRTGQSIWSLND